MVPWRSKWKANTWMLIISLNFSGPLWTLLLGEILITLKLKILGVFLSIWNSIASGASNSFCVFVVDWRDAVSRFLLQKPHDILWISVGLLLVSISVVGVFDLYKCSKHVFVERGEDNGGGRRRDGKIIPFFVWKF